MVQQHAATFYAQAEDAAGADLPQFVKDGMSMMRKSPAAPRTARVATSMVQPPMRAA